MTFTAPERPSPENVSRLRVYRYSIVTSALRVQPEDIDERFLLSNRLFLEGSGIQGVQELIESEPRESTLLDRGLWG